MKTNYNFGSLGKNITFPDVSVMEQSFYLNLPFFPLGKISADNSGNFHLFKNAFLPSVQGFDYIRRGLYRGLKHWIGAVLKEEVPGFDMVIISLRCTH